MIDARIPVEEFAVLAKMYNIQNFIDVLKSHCSIMLFDPQTRIYTLTFTRPNWFLAIEEFPQLKDYYYAQHIGN